MRLQLQPQAPLHEPDSAIQAKHPAQQLGKATSLRAIKGPKTHDRAACMVLFQQTCP